MYSVAVVVFAAALVGHRVTSETAVRNPDTGCPHRNLPLEGRKSPLDSVTFSIAEKEVKVCYGRPSSRGRVMLGSADIPYGKIWRTGANEPTILFAPISLKVAGVSVAPGVYSLYTVPGQKEWEVIVNRSTSQWGAERNYTAEVKAQEVGRAKVKAETVNPPVETFTIRAEPSGNRNANLVLEWEKARIRIPVQAG
ncbi:MAG TPA: DUF2911 domain-containing protein [Gemmatimonadales bacterium]|nr:DUF2911 domain-containing protein [Gemmatimonadales bacterium]